MKCHLRKLIVITAAAMAGASARASDAPVLSRDLQKTFEAVRAAYFAGDSYEVRQALAPTVARVSDAQISALNRALAAEEIPSVEELLVDARLKLAQQELGGALPEPGLRERLLTLVGLERHTASILEKHADHPLLADDPVNSHELEQLERELWGLHVLKNELLTAFRCTNYAEELAWGIPEATFGRLAATDKATVALSRVPDLTSIERARREVLEAELSRRLHRLEVGVTLLKDASFRRERFLAAYSTQLDASVLTAFFAEQRAHAEPPHLTCKPLSDPETPERVTALAAEAGQLAGGLAERSRLFFDGLHWWLRGRYGAGPDVGGLAKSAAALDHRGALLWLSMPSALPEPTDPADPASAALPAVERRHHYTWAWEDRRVQQRASYSVKNTTKTVRQRLPSFW